MPVIMEGFNGTFIGNQDTVFQAHTSVREAMMKIDNNEAISKDSANSYLEAFDLVEMLHGLDTKQKKYCDYLKKLA